MLKITVVAALSALFAQASQRNIPGQELFGAMIHRSKSETTRFHHFRGKNTRRPFDRGPDSISRPERNQSLRCSMAAQAGPKQKLLPSQVKLTYSGAEKRTFTLNPFFKTL